MIFVELCCTCLESTNPKSLASGRFMVNEILQSYIWMSIEYLGVYMSILIQSMRSLLIQFPPPPAPRPQTRGGTPLQEKCVVASPHTLSRTPAHFASARASARRWPCCTRSSTSTTPRCCRSSSRLVLTRWIGQLPLLMWLITRWRHENEADPILIKLILLICICD